MHISVIDVGEELPMWALGSHFGCPLCPKVKPTSLKKIKWHFEGHINTALHFREKIICRCNMPCRGLAHYHCPYCYKTLLVKRHMERHVKLCSTKTTLTVVTPTQSPQLPLSTPGRLPPPLQADFTPNRPPLHDHDYTLLALTSSDSTEVVPNSHCAPSPHQHESAPERSAPPPESSSEKPPQLHDAYLLLALTSTDSANVDSVNESEVFSSAKASRVKYLKRTKCPHCALILYQKNLNVHIQRKHKKDS